MAALFGKRDEWVALAEKVLADDGKTDPSPLDLRKLAARRRGNRTSFGTGRPSRRAERSGPRGAVAAQAAHTSDRRRASDIFDAIEKKLQPTPHWRSILKAIVATRHLVVYGAEHVVDRAWRLKPQLRALKAYNSATVLRGNETS